MDIHIFDNGGKTKDRYCLVIGNGKVYTMTPDPLSLNGVRYLCEAIDLDTKAAGKPVAIQDMPEALRNRIESNARNWCGKNHTPR